MIKIGTRGSELALWQAKHVQQLLEKNNVASEIIIIKSEGDVELKKPLYEMGITGVFTKELDYALINKKIDIAVHSLKDVPTALPKGVVYGAFLERGAHEDVIVYKGTGEFIDDKESGATIATSSLRRKAAWLYNHPNHTIENLRGNINMRIQKLINNTWDGAIFAKAGLDRINLLSEIQKNNLKIRTIDTMISAPAQGIVTVLCREEDQDLRRILATINSLTSEKCAFIERDFLRTLEGGCTAPIGAFAKINEENNEIILTVEVYSKDGKNQVKNQFVEQLNNYKNLGHQSAKYIIENNVDILNYLK